MHNKLFPSQKPYEKIYIITRQHWFVLFKSFLILLILFLAPLLILPLIKSAEIISQNTDVLNIINFFLLLYWTALFVALFVVWTLYYLNIYIVSEERVVDIDQYGLLKRVVSELNIESIEDVSSETVGIFGNFLNFGTVHIQTAGAAERFQFELVPDPAHTANVILTLFEAQNDGHKKK